MQQEVSLSPPSHRDVSSTLVKRSLYLAKGYDKLKLEPDSSCSWFYSKKFEKILYGRESLELFKFQSGVKIGSSQRESTIRVSPSQITFSSRPFEGLLLTQTVRIHSAESSAYSRVIKLTSRSGAQMKLRLVTLHDPTSLNFRREKDPPGEIGVNAFNRGAHVVMDDVGDGTGVRVFGAVPSPSVIYMTREKQTATDLMAAGELPEQTAGISGAIAILTQHDVDLTPSGTFEIRMTSLYNPSRLEEALLEFNGLSEFVTDRTSQETEPSFASSSPSLNFSFSWAKARLESIEQETDLLDTLFSASALRTLRPSYLKTFLERVKSLQRKDGFLSHSLDPMKPGVLETSQFLIAACEFVLVQGDKKFSRVMQAPLRRAADALAGASTAGLVNCDPSLPQGWRRRLRSGYPTGIISEVNLAVSRALKEYSSFARTVGKGADSAKYLEMSKKIISSVSERLVDQENGIVMLNVDSKGRQHKEITIDSAVAISYNSFDNNMASSIVHRLLDKDFETAYGPRTVPSSNPLYFSSSYGEGQLGGYSTRAALTHALLSYQSGYGGIGSMQLEKIAKLVHMDCERMGGVPGEFPYWLDPDRKAITTHGSDAVAASRLVDLILYGELGLSFDASRLEMRPAKNSRLKWLSAQRFHVGCYGSFFLGREGERVYSATTFQRLESKDALKFTNCEKVPSNPALECLHFFGPTQLLCAGNTSNSNVSTSASIPLKDNLLSKSLFAGIDELDPETGRWNLSEKVRSSEKLSVKVSLNPNSWKMLRISQIMT